MHEANQKSAQLLLRRPKPLPEESLHSWLTRLAAANGFVTPDRLLTYLGVRLGKCDLDFIEDEEIFARLSKYTGVAQAAIKSLGFRSYEGALVHAFMRSGYDTRVLIEGVDRVPLQYGTGTYAICPICIREDKVPIVRKMWRFSFLTYCTKHRCQLSDACGNCGKKWVVSSKVAWDVQRCLHCEHPIGKRWKRRSELANSDLSSLIENVGHIRKKTLDAFRAHNEVELWEGLSWIARFLMGDSLRGVSSVREINAHLSAIPPDSARRFEAMSVHGRESVLQVIDMLLTDWPENFFNFCKEANVGVNGRYERINMPGWIGCVFEGGLRLRSKSPSPDRVREVVEALRKQGVMPSKNRVKKILKLTESRSIDQVLPGWSTQFSQSHLEALLNAMHRRVCITPVARDEQAAVVRDSIAITLCLFSNLKPERVMDLDRIDASAFWRKKVIRVGMKTPNYVKHLQYWWELYYGTIRPIFLERARLNGPSTEYRSPPFFLTRFGKRYGGNGIPRAMAALLEEIGYPHPERGIGVRRDIRFAE